MQDCLSCPKGSFILASCRYLSGVLVEDSQIIRVSSAGTGSLNLATALLNSIIPELISEIKHIMDG